jgi:hypothetical protein
LSREIAGKSGGIFPLSASVRGGKTGRFRKKAKKIIFSGEI